MSSPTRSFFCRSASPCSARSLSGLSFISFLIAVMIIVPSAITIMRTVPVYIEYFSIKRAMLRAVKECHECSKEEIKTLYTKQALIDEISSVHASDLEIKQGGKAEAGNKSVSLYVEYSRKQELIEGSGVSLLFEFQITEP
jgi:Domain of unknown function (DUF4845)